MGMLGSSIQYVRGADGLALTNTQDITFATGKALRTGVTAADTLLLQAYDLDAPGYTTFITLAAHATTPTCTLANITMSGTWLASGTVTLPNLTMGPTIIISGVSPSLTFTRASGNYPTIDAGSGVAFNIQVTAASSAGEIDYIVSGNSAGTGHVFKTGNAAGTATVRFRIYHLATTAVVSWLAVGISHTFIGDTTAANDSINPAPTATTLTMANTKSFTGIAHNIMLPAIVPVANGAGITLTGLNMAQGAITNAADSETITVKHIVATGAAGVALATGVYSWTWADITMPAQAANGAINVAHGIKITGGAMAGGAGAYQRGVDITMAAATDDAIYIGTGILNCQGTLKFGTYTATPATDSIGYVAAQDAAGNAIKIMIQA